MNVVKVDQQELSVPLQLLFILFSFSLNTTKITIGCLLFKKLRNLYFTLESYGHSFGASPGPAAFSVTIQRIGLLNYVYMHGVATST